jgi:hypothetical protein
MTRPRLLLALTVTLAVSMAAHATLVRAIPFDERVENAAAIVMGKCVAQESRWDNAHQWILTYSTFEVQKTMKGFPMRTITIVTPGGSVDGLHQETVGVPKFREGDEHVLFVRNSKVGPTVLDFEQGDYHVLKNDRGERVVQPAVTSSVLIDMQRGAAVSPESVRSLNEFETTVREMVRVREIQKMDLIQQRKREQASIGSVLMRNRVLVIFALLGAILATWQLVKRS